MSRKIIVTLFVVAMLMSMVAVAAAAGTPNDDPTTKGCFVDDTLTTVNEGVAIPVTVKCVGIPTDNNVFGFQFGSDLTGNFVGTAPEAYTPGDFVNDAVDGVLVGSNVPALYGVSRTLNDVVDTTDFTLGSYALTAVTDRGTGAGLTDADGTVAIDFNDAAFMLSDNLGEELTGWLRTVNDTSTNVNDIDLAWLSGHVTVQSDSPAIGNIKTVVVNLGAYQYTTTGVTADYTADLPVNSSNLYVENASGVVGGSFATAADSNNVLNIVVSADMYGHLACSTSAVNLGDLGAVENVNTIAAIGTSGTITLKAGDVVTVSDAAINIQDATAVGAQFVSGTPSGQTDINQDGKVDILDLVQVGRNYNATEGNCV